MSQAAQGAAARAYRESLWEQLRELLGHTADDPGHWNYSPEWMGSAGGGFGRDDGQVIFSRQSPFNGRVEVTAHEASNSGFATDVPTAVSPIGMCSKGPEWSSRASAAAPGSSNCNCRGCSAR